VRRLAAFRRAVARIGAEQVEQANERVTAVDAKARPRVPPRMHPLTAPRSRRCRFARQAGEQSRASPLASKGSGLLQCWSSQNRRGFGMPLV
jgi:hypothetical protein